MDLRTELIEFLEAIREYGRESGTNIAYDERESSEFVDIHLQSKSVCNQCRFESDCRFKAETIEQNCKFRFSI